MNCLLRGWLVKTNGERFSLQTYDEAKHRWYNVCTKPSLTGINEWAAKHGLSFVGKSGIIEGYYKDNKGGYFILVKRTTA